MSLNKNDKIIMEAFPADPSDKHAGGFYRYEREDMTLIGRGIKEISFQQNPYQRDKFDLSISLDKNDEHTRETALALLAAAGFPAEVKSNGNAQGMRVMVKNVGETDLMKSVIALAQDIPKDRHDTHFALLSREEAAQIIPQELDRLKTTPLNAGLIHINRAEMTPERRRELGVATAMGYMDIDFTGYPIGPVAFMREDAVPVGEFGTTRMEISTQLQLSESKADALRETLAQAGIKSKKVSDTHLSVNAGADSIAMALAKGGFLPAAISVEASLAAKQLRPDYVASETRGQPLAMTAKTTSLG